MEKMNLQFFAAKALADGDKIERKYCAHMIDASFGAAETNYVRIGKDLEEYSIELNPDVETTKNILGENSVRHNGYEVSADADPYYAYVGDPLFEHLQQIIDTRATGSDCKTTTLEVHLWEETSGTYKAYREDCYVIPNSYGGDTSGYQIPFTVHYDGNRVEGTYDPNTKKFTEKTTTTE